MAIIEQIRKQLEHAATKHSETSTVHDCPEAQAEREAFQRMLMQNPEPSAACKSPLLSPDVKMSEAVFEDHVQSAYSLGLAKTYALETIDPKSIRKLGAAKEKKQTPSKSYTPPTYSLEDIQYQLDLGPAHRDWVQPLMLLQPLSSLRLSSQAEHALFRIGCHSVSDVIQRDLASSGIPQGHIDEIENKLDQSALSQQHGYCRHFDIASLLRILAAQSDVRKVCLLLEEFGLHEALSLPTATWAEVKRVTSERRKRWSEEAQTSLLNSDAYTTYQECTSEVVLVFIARWLRQRGGLGRRFEISERLAKITSNSMLLAPFLKFARDTFHQGSCPLSAFLPAPEPDLFCADDSTLEHYEAVRNCALSYFVKPTDKYELEHLTRLVAQQLCRAWLAVDEKFIRTSIRLSNYFSVQKGFCGQCMVYLTAK